MTYNEYYTVNKNAFGKEPEKILVEHSHLLNKEYPIVDLGAGEGRNTLYLARLGYSVDAIDPSSVSIHLKENVREVENLSYRTYQAGYKEFKGISSYSGILVFGLMQILDWDEIEILKRRLSGWMREGSLLFITAFTTSDDSHQTIRKNSRRIDKNSYIKENGEKRTFFEPGELKNIFRDYKELRYWEGLGPEHRHGDSPWERHAMVEAVFQKKE